MSTDDPRAGPGDRIALLVGLADDGVVGAEALVRPMPASRFAAHLRGAGLAATVTAGPAPSYDGPP